MAVIRSQLRKLYIGEGRSMICQDGVDERAVLQQHSHVYSAALLYPKQLRFFWLDPIVGAVLAEAVYKNLSPAE